jgi:hypothetical protein
MQKSKKNWMTSPVLCVVTRKDMITLSFVMVAIGAFISGVSCPPDLSYLMDVGTTQLVTPSLVLKEDPSLEEVRDKETLSDIVTPNHISLKMTP